MVMGSSGVPRGPVHTAGVTGAASGVAVFANGVAGAGSGSDSSPFFRRARRARMAEGVAFLQPALRFSQDRMAVRRDEKSLLPPVMLFKLESVLKIGALGPELAAELDGHVATSILVASG